MIDVLCPVCGERTLELNPRCKSCGTFLPAPLEAELDPSFEDLETAGAIRGFPFDPLVGSHVDHFHILSRIGQGGMGVVYRATDLDLGREVALKFLSLHRSKSLKDEERFRREARAAASLDHPNIGTIYEVGEHQGRLFLAMAFYDSETLADRLDRARDEGSPVPVSEALSIAGQIAAALTATHAAGIVHRDLKPSNVLLTREGRVKLVDFGIARTAQASVLTEVGAVLGTAAYMAPEQLRAETVDARTDLWALGVVIHEMLAGRHPFRLGKSGASAAQAIFTDAPQPLRELRPEVPPELERLVARCLTKDPAGRPQTAEEAAAELRRLEHPHGTGESTAPPGLVQESSFLRRHGRLAGIALGLLLLSGAAFVRWRGQELYDPLYVAVAKPEVSGPVSAEDHALVAANLQTAALRALTALNGIAPLDITRDQDLKRATAMAAAQATGAREVLFSRADCSRDDLCQVTMQRRSGQDGRVLWSDTFQSLRSQSRLFANTVAASVRRGYPDRALRFEHLELQVEDADYDRYLELQREEEIQGIPTDELIRQAAELRSQSPSFIEAYLFESALARQRFVATGERKYLDMGLESARPALALAPEDPRPLLRLFDLSLEAGQLEEAETTLRQLEGLEASPDEILVRRARLAERRGALEEALELMRDTVKLRPSWSYLLSLANMEYRQGKLQEARKHLNELLAQKPDHIRALQTLAQIELLGGDLEKAVELLGQLTERTPEATPLTNLGVAQMILHRYGDAETSFRRALALNPGDVQITLNLADCRLLLGRSQEASKLYWQVVEQIDQAGAPSQWVILSLQAQALAHLGEKRRAIERIQEALRLTPDNAQLAFEAALVYTLLDDHSSALFHAERAVDSGINKRWFDLSWFDPLRPNPAFRALTQP